ncbi:MAG TPA: ATP-binding protein, partial [Bacteroidaceae bacterium]|nr:ATP-binding protein [Bacteroidaceae bacterium]
MAETKELLNTVTPEVQYDEDNIRHMDDMEHIRTRPGMYIGKLGDGSQADDGIYVLLKEVIDNSVDEFRMNCGKRIEITQDELGRITVRDYGRGIPLGKLVEAVSMLNTGGKFDSKAFKKSVGLNGVGLKAVNALSVHFEVSSHRDGQARTLHFERGELKSDETVQSRDESGTGVTFEPDSQLFKGYQFRPAIIETMLRNYTYLNTGLTITYNGQRFMSRNGLEDLLGERMSTQSLY